MLIYKLDSPLDSWFIILPSVNLLYSCQRLKKISDTYTHDVDFLFFVVIKSRSTFRLRSIKEQKLEKNYTKAIYIEINSE